MKTETYAVAIADEEDLSCIDIEFVQAISNNHAMIISIEELIDPADLIRIDFSKDPPDEIARKFGYLIEARKCPNVN